MRIRAKKHVLSFAAVMALVLGGGMQLYAVDKKADTVYHNGTIYTMTETLDEAKDVNNAKKVDVVATLNGKIVFVGSKSEAEKAGYLDAANVEKIVDLKGKTMLPGFVDGHGHFPSQGQYDLYEVNLNSYPLGTMTCIDDYVVALKAQSDKINDPNQWIVGWGYDDTLVTDMAHPTRQQLDAIPNPVWIRHISGHMGVANTKALELAGVMSWTPEKMKAQSGLILAADGTPTGLLRETGAMGLVTNVLDKAYKPNRQKALARANQVYAAAGVTTADGGTSAIVGDMPMFQQGMLKNAFDVRVMFHPIGYITSYPAYGTMSRSALGWSGNDYRDATNAKQTGDDISGLHVTSLTENGLVNYENVDPTYKNVVPHLGEFKNKVFLGAWKLMCDGSPQGYTGWMKYPGYYKLGAFEMQQEIDMGGFSKEHYYSGKDVQGKSVLNTEPEDIPTAIEIYHAAGQSTEMHLNGNASGEAWIAGLESVLAKNRYADIEDTRHTVIHGQFLERQQIQRQMGLYDQLGNKEENDKMYVELKGAMATGVPSMDFVKDQEGCTSDVNVLAERMKKQHIFNSYFLTHTYFYGDRHREIFFGPGRANQMSPAGWSVAYGQKYSFHNDTFVTPIDPLQNIQSAVTRTSAHSKMWEGGTLISGSSKDLNATVEYRIRPDMDETQTYWDYDQRLNILQAMHGMTAMPAWQNKMENKLGSIRTGLFADFTILDDDPVKVAAADPQKIASIRVTTTIVGDKPIHGFLPDAENFLDKPIASYTQPDEKVAVTVTDASFIPNEDAEKAYVVPMKDAKRLGTYGFEATVENGDTAVFQMSFLGNGGTVEGMKLFKLVNETQSHEYIYSESREMDNGNWWIAPLSDPVHALKLGDTLTPNESYVAFFVITDNGVYDADADLGKIADPVTLMTSGELPTNASPVVPSKDDGGGSSSGCTVGGAPSYDLLVLFLGLSAVAAIRVLRRKDSE